MAAESSQPPPVAVDPLQLSPDQLSGPSGDDQRANALQFPLPLYGDMPRDLTTALRSMVDRYELRAGAPLRRSVAVTSVRGRTQGTRASQALATVLAHDMDRLVCWFDLSWLSERRASDRPEGADLLDLLEDHSRIGGAFVQSPEIDRLVSLSFSPVPASKRNAIVRLPAFEALMKIVDDEFDHVILDTPPLLDSPNVFGVLRHADLSLIVARHRSDTLADIKNVLEESEPTANLGVLVTDYTTKIPRRLQRLLAP